MFDIKILKNWKWAFLFILALLVKCTLAKYYAVVHGDKSMMVAGAINIAKGNGYTYPVVHIYNVEQPEQRPLIEWPPLYSVLLAPVLKFTDFDIEGSCFIIDVAAAFFNLLFFFLLFRKLELPSRIQLLLLFYKAFLLNHSVIYSYATDLWAENAWLAALYFLLTYLEKPSLLGVVLLSLVNVSTFYFRYMYLPVSLVLPLLLIWDSSKKPLVLRKYAWTSLGITLSGIVALLAYNYIVSRELFYIISPEQGFFPENLQHLSPVFWIAFINTDFYAMQVSLRTAFSYTEFYNFLKISSAIILLILLRNYLVRFIRFHFRAPANKRLQLKLYGGAVAIAIIIVLLYISLTNSSRMEKVPGVEWTFLNEERYFQVSALIILILVVESLFQKNVLRRRAIILGRYIFIIICSIEILHGCWILVKNYKRPGESYSVFINWKERRKNYLDALFQNEKKRGNDIVVISNEYDFIAYPIINNIKVIREVEELQVTHLEFKQKTVLVLAIAKESSIYYQPLIDKHNFKFETDLDGYYIFKRYFN